MSTTAVGDSIRFDRADLLQHQSNLIYAQQRQSQRRLTDGSLDASDQVDHVGEPWKPIVLISWQTRKLLPKCQACMVEQRLQFGIALAIQQLLEVSIDVGCGISKEEDLDRGRIACITSAISAGWLSVG